MSDQTLNPSYELIFQAVGERAVGYTTFGNSCGLIPEDQFMAGELFPGGTVEFNVCWQVASEDVDSLVMYVEPLVIVDTPQVWFSLQPE